MKKPNYLNINLNFSVFHLILVFVFKGRKYKLSIY